MSFTMLDGLTLHSKGTPIPDVLFLSTSRRFQRSLFAPRKPAGLGIKAFASNLSELPSPLREEGHVETSNALLKPLPRKIEGVVDDPRLHNPLARLQRLGTGWMGVILELEGVCVEYEYGDVSDRAWLQLAQEEGKPPPPIWALRKAEGMKNEQALQEVFNWTRNPVEARRLASRKEELLAESLKDRIPMVPPAVPQLLDILERSGAPVAVVSSAPERRVHAVLRESGLSPRFEVVVTGDDVNRGRPDPEGYLYAAQRIGRPPVRCIVVGNSNVSVEAAHEVGMQCVAVAGRHPVYELTAADLVVRSLGELSFINLKQLFALEEGVMPHDDDGDEETEFLEEDQDQPVKSTATAVMDW